MLSLNISAIGGQVKLSQIPVMIDGTIPLNELSNFLIYADDEIIYESNYIFRDPKIPLNHPLIICHLKRNPYF